MSEVPGFDKEKFDALWTRYENQDLALGEDFSPEVFSLLAECISLAVENGKVCVELPLKIGKKCIDVPDWVPNGSIAKACLEVKYKTVLGVKIPIGIDVCVYVADQKVACAYFGI
ncbi:hypothetical protein [Synechococcus sp. CS-1332]|uniref:hypothetical protein n=1 Tax=Synechococcus sp. CS-1332 TaxID=2847972 RepID=UPI00223BCD95|nr:hypothetical protein [Synechococcus sp. CS-1332]MCT0207733.1 hypothetical protein [Synechococcus sp. CS-1332]